MLQTWWELFWGFFVANILGYGGGPASIPLMQEEIVNHYHWMTTEQFGDVLAIGNTLPGPIATKIAAFVGYHVAGWFGALIASFATIVPSAVALILLLRLLNKHRTSPKVKGMTLLVQPVIAVLMILLTWEFGQVSTDSIGIWQTLIIAGISLWVMTKTKLHPAILILIAFAYGALVLSHTM
ncbi:chromate transporter [Paenibacillus polysaccharolyticus]|uniref:chromate transporter n=1 Tax=Paenibacillus polysaccharolyticus TaxID=582692 RepID=UPI00209CE0EC|nr:chromate transporter [Paenibacillus polysaccharolyticus]MCP1136514.1 chromate transporter [Paenibacillus polysaccharolyticus]